MKRILTIFLCFLSVMVVRADINVKGTVIDADGSEPLIGVSILVKGSSVGTVTDFDGNFELVVPDKSTLQLSYIGYKTIEIRAVSGPMQIIMESDAQQLQEVVSLGYSAVKKAELSSAVVSISSEDLTDVASSDVGNMLQGKIAGVQVTNAGGQPGDAAQIRIRGTGSITASSAPVYVVDGVMGGTFNPNDVETISVLKDAGSTGIYGAAAAGGVIVVTTKSGKKGDKVSVDLKANVGGKQALFGNFKVMEAMELLRYHRTLFSAGTFSILYEDDYEYLKKQNWNWQNEFFHTGLIHNYNVAVRGGSEHVGYYASLDYFGEQGTLMGTGMQKVTGHASIKADIAKWLDMNVKVDFNKSTVNYASSWMMLDDAFYKMPWDCPYVIDAAGNPTSEYVYINSTTRPDNNRPWYSHTQWNSLQSAQYNYAKSNSFDFSGVLQLNVHFTDWLHFSTTNTFSTGYSKGSEYTDRRTYHDTFKKGYLSEGIGLSRSFGSTNILKGGNQWGAHSFNAMVGFEAGVWKSEYTTAAGTGMPSGIDALNASAPYGVRGYNIPGASWSVFLQASYDYAKRYFVTATYRAEASSIFAPSHRVGHFPSVAASWLISNEGFMKDQKVVSFLKLRASYGITGNNNIPPYQYLSTFSLSNLYQNNVGATSSRLASPDLRWETAYMASIGIDLTFIKRIDMSIDLYQTDNTDLLLDVPVAPSSGFFKVTKNAGSVRNRGIEYRIDANIFDKNKWRWDVGFNIGFNQNRVTETPDHTPFLQTAINVSQQVKEGQDIFTWYMKEWAGVDPATGSPLWYVVDKDTRDYVLDANGNKTTTSDYNATYAHAVGTASPVFSGGLNTQVSWNGIFLHINTNFTYGNKIYNSTREMTDADGAYTDINQLSLDAQGWTRWTKAGDIATHPKATSANPSNSNAVSSRYLEDGSFFRLRNLTVGYDFPLTLIKKAHMTKCRLYFTADNLWTATKFSGMDPEVNMVSGNNTLAGLYSSNYPVGRTFQGGVEISF
ncbi:MAG: SusC/RagA family TonB-linked outer membrane protein [Paludibacteraceae bacterium]|nr:SusC/RagA family TonB-linked outer membrane protein [Paludibacteraceae bacterium]